ncbi:integrase [Leucobacter exalbidus]|uniref:Integrase n=1 Tax=Leucobacter exalbidus TaxID=662960 RepID=A0A940T4U3_9MICO|nr:integrase [Leucobacter exalbidus]
MPDDAMKLCPSCEEPRGNRRQGWQPIYQGDEIRGYTCPACPEWGEPIRRVETARGARFVAVVDATPPGAAKRKQTKKTLVTLEEARQWVAEVRAEVAERGGLSSRELTVAQAFEDWLGVAELKPPTVRNYRAQFKPVADAFGTLPVRELEPHHVEKLIASMKSGGKRDGKPFGKWAIRAAVGRLSQALDRLVRHRLLTQNVVQLVDKPKDKRSMRRTFEYWKTTGVGDAAKCPNFDKFRRVADEHRDAGAWRLTLCGMTRADIMGLRWDGDVHFDESDPRNSYAEVNQGRVILDGKDDHVDDAKSEQRYRKVYFERLEPGTVALLRKMKARQAAEKLAAVSAYEDSGYVVVNEAGKPLRPELYSDRFRSLCRKAGVPVIHLHKIRHSLAALLHERGWSVRRAARLLGHTKQVHITNYLPDADNDTLDDLDEQQGAA